MEQSVFVPGYNSGQYRVPGVGGAVSGAPPVSTSVAPQGSKLATYMNRGGPTQPQNFHDINNKMNNMSLDHSMKMMNRPPNPGNSFPGPHNSAPFQRPAAGFPVSISSIATNI